MTVDEYIDQAATLVGGSITVNPGEEVLHYADWGGILCGEETGLWTVDESVLFEGCDNPCPDCAARLWSPDLYHLALGGNAWDPVQSALCGVFAARFYTEPQDFVIMPVAKCSTCVSLVVSMTAVMIGAL